VRTTENATRRALVGILVAGAFSGCTVAGSDYRPPSVATPASWTATAPSLTAGGSPELSRWWAVFGDPVLDSLIAQAAQANLDLRLAEERVLEARAQLGVPESELWPSLSLGAVYWHGRENLPPAPPEGVVGSLYRPGFDASWELDLFGGRRRAVEAAGADLGAIQEERHAVLVTLFAEVGRTYVELRGLQRQIAVARETVATQAETLQMVRARLEAGLASEFDVDRAEAQMATVEAVIPALESSRQRCAHRLAVLLGREPGALSGLLDAAAPIPVPPPNIGVGLPADLLLRRPDLRRAERDLAAATARTGVAEADLYPRLSVAGSLGSQTGEFGELADWSSRIWSYGLALRWPIFDAGRVRAAVRVQNARQEQASTRYRRALLAAREEVENAFVAFGSEDARRRSLATAAAANTRALETARALYGTGLTDYLQVLDAQRALYTVRAQLVQSETAAASDLVALYKALGGGWESGEAPTPAAGR